MSYVRFGEGGSDVYVYPSSSGIECCGCRFPADRDPTFTSRQKAIDHLVAHQEAGHTVPDYVIERLRQEIESMGDRA